MAKLRCILLPGLDGTGQFFNAFADAISSYANPTVIAYPRDRLLSYDELVEYVAAQLPRDEDYCLIAESFSGPIAILLASRKPPHLKALILAVTFAVSPYPKASWTLSKLLIIMKHFSISKKFIQTSLLNGSHPELAERIHRVVSTLDKAVIAGRAKSAMLCNVLGALKQITVPILAIQAKQDRVLSPKCLDDMVKANPAIRAARVDAPHCLLQVEAKSVSEKLVEPFLHEFAFDRTR